MIFVSIMLLMSVNIHSSAKEKSGSGILLSGYLFHTGKNEVALISLTDANLAIRSISLKGKDAAAFRIVDKNQLIILNKYNRSDKKWYDITIVAETSSGRFTENFRIVNDQFIRNQVIAHRGAWKNTGATENSIASLKRAIELGCMGSEFDVHMSSDSVLYIHHDPFIDKDTIEKTPSHKLSAVRLSNGETLPTLEAYLKEGMKQNKTRLILEIKPSIISKERAIALTHKVLDMVKKLRAQAWVDYISFDYEVCKEVMRIDPYAKVAYLNGDKTPDELASEKFYGLDYNQNVYKKNESWIKEAQQKNLTVNVWTVNDEADMDWFLQRNVDFITTNEPELLLKKVKKD
ncbi:glycerophosphodiester phosphodiesterase [Rubrolithibacter danxiaensis]|uniref:glycerophosphodiester phosphodiesterase n=1 Tax=Rubrolithibacter danxiaensis TaxID=3390805 RepID=UPI003BF86D78